MYRNLYFEVYKVNQFIVYDISNIVLRIIDDWRSIIEISQKKHANNLLIENFRLLIENRLIENEIGKIQVKDEKFFINRFKSTE